MKYFKWLDGRQKEAKYKKMCLYSFKLLKWGLDCYIIKIPPKTLIDWHTDPVINGKHWRKNVVLSGFATFLRKRLDGKIDCVYWFRPDIEPHMLQTYDQGITLISFGFVKYN